QNDTARKRTNVKIILDDEVDAQRGLIKKPGMSRTFSKGSKTLSMSKDKGRNVDSDGFLVPDLPNKMLPAKQAGKEKDGTLQVDTMSASSSVGKANSPLEELELEAKNKTVSGDFFCLSCKLGELKHFQAIKRRTLSALEAIGISKTHVEFKDMNLVGETS
ncbi:2292_t:CDS:1, partial [Acaulospora colombiana]